MVLWSRALPKTASCLSPFLSGMKSQLANVRKLPIVWGKAVVFAGYLGFLHQLQLASQDLAAIWHKRDEKQNSKFSPDVIMSQWTAQNRPEFEL